MATVNRFTNIEPAKYNPRSLQELMMVPAYKRQQHTATEEQLAAAETALAQVDPLAVHSDLAKMEQQKLYDQITAQSEQLASKGFTSTSKSDVIRLNKNYQQAISPTGSLGKIQTAKKNLEANKAAYIANSTKLGYAADTTAKNWEEHQKEYEAEFARTGTITNITERYSPNYINATETLKDLFVKAGVSSNELGTLTSNIITNDPNNPGQYILTQGAKESHSNNIEQLQYAVDYVNNQISNPNSEIGRSLKEQRKTPEQALQEVEGLNKVFEKSAHSKVTSSEISGYKSASELGITTTSNEPLMHEFDPDSTVEVYASALETKLGNILSKKMVQTSNDLRQTSIGTTGTALSSTDYGKTEQASITNQLNKEERAEYDKLYNSLQENDPALKGVSPYSVLAVNKVRAYYNKNKSIQRQNIVITDDFVKVYGDRSIGTDGTNRAKITESVQANPESRKYFIEGSKRAVSYDELPNDIKKNFNKMTYSGYYSPKNFLTDQYGKSQDKKLFVSPLKMQYRDDDGKLTNVLVSRSATELNSPEYQADTEFNDIFVNTNKLPDIPYTVPKPNGTPSNIQVVYLSQPIIQNGKVGSYMINRKLTDGTYGAPILATEEELQSSILEANGATPTNLKKKK